MGCCGSRKTKVRPLKKGDLEVDDDDDNKRTLDDGPIGNRRCRDIIFLIIFIMYMLGMGYIAYLGIKQGDPYRLIYGVDSWGNTCHRDNSKIDGVPLSGEKLVDKKKLFYFNPAYFASHVPSLKIPSLHEEVYFSVCIPACPSETLNSSTAVDNLRSNGINLCRYDIEEHTDDDDKKCPTLPVRKHISLFNRCIPEGIYDIAISTATHFATAFSDITLGSNIPEKIISDLKTAWKEILYLCAVAFGVSLVIVFLMGILAAIIIWVLVIAVVGISLAATAYCWYSWYSTKMDLDELPKVEQTEERKEKVETWLIYSGISSAIAIVLLLILLVMRSRISLVIQLFREAGKAIRRVPMILLQPVWTLIALVGVVVSLAVIAVYIETSGLPSVNNSTGSVKMKMEDVWDYVRWYHYFGMLWSSAFVVACQDIIVAGAVVIWYFKRDKSQLGWPILVSLKRLIRYHLGSVAFGSLIIALVRLLRLILGYINAKLKGKTGKVVEFIMKCLKCCLWCFERFLAYLNRNAYIEIAIYGYSFCKAAQKAFLLIVSNALRVAAISSIGTFVLLLGKIAAVGIVMVVGNEMFKNRTDINYMWAPITAGCTFAFAISHCFLLIYEITIDTIFLCFCEDCEMNDGVTKPYYMSKGLMKYLDDSRKAEMKRNMRQKKEDTNKMELSTV